MSKKNRKRKFKKTKKEKKKSKEIISEEKPKKKDFYSNITKFYDTNFNRFLIILILLTVFSFGSLIFNFVMTGDLIQRDVSLSGGISITINTDKPLNTEQIQNELSAIFRKSSINVRSLQISGEAQGIIIEDSNPEDEPMIIEFMETKIDQIPKDNISVETMGSSLGKSFFREMFIALFFAFLCMGLVFIYYFRNLFATFAALLSAFLDIFITLGIITAMQVKLTSGGIASFLMLIGYCIDSSILISTKLIKEKNVNLTTGLHEAMKTGLTMSAAGIAATLISFLLTNNVVLKQIMLILVIGLIINFIACWVGNVAILKYYLKKNE
ncbi:hypothetical protein JXB41_09155 [Candidatus Woesearchaeota archaeon]|nr:hypothetical protein [Candidatus Woesearchaeota archaeon]